MKDKILQEDLDVLCFESQEWLDVLDGKTVMVTGVTGLIGSQLVKTLLYYNYKQEKNIQVVGIARNAQKVENVYRDFEIKNNLNIYYQDVRDVLDVPQGIDYVIHCANTTSSKEYVQMPVETIDTIIRGTTNIMEFARSRKVKSVVYLSSMEMYGETQKGLDFIDETDSGYINPLSVRSSYPEGKRMAECICASYAAEYGVNVKIARLAQVFGADVSQEDNRIFAQLAKCAINKENFIMHTLGKSYGNYCYTRDAVKAILMLLSKGNQGEAYNVVNEETCRMIGDMAHMVAKEVAEGKFQVVIDIPESSLTYGYAPDVQRRLSSKKMNALGWEAEVPLKEMYIRMIESMKYRQK